MKTIKSYLKPFTIFLSLLILVQGCTVYKSANVTLEEAVRAETVVRVKINKNKTLKFNRIGFENDYYYGLNFKTGDEIKIRLDENKINKIQVKDKTFSTILTVAIPVVIIGLVIGGIALAAGGIGGGFGGI